MLDAVIHLLFFLQNGANNLGHSGSRERLAQRRLNGIGPYPFVHSRRWGQLIHLKTKPIGGEAADSGV